MAVNRTPKNEYDGEVKQRKEAPHGEIHAVNQIALQADQKGLAVFGEGGEHRMI
jgi:hypothetical protein